MRTFILLLLFPTLAFAWGPFQATSLRRAPGMEWHWIMKTATAGETIELDCQSFIHQFHHNKDGRRIMSIVVDEYECKQAENKLRSCFLTTRKACVKGTVLPEVSCGKCP